MRIYVSHSQDFDYQDELYKPLLSSAVATAHQLILPFVNGAGQSADTKTVLQAVNLVVAEVTHSNTGQGIELGWADMLGKPIICFYRSGYPPSSSISMLTQRVYPYKEPLDLVRQLEDMLSLKPLPAAEAAPGYQVMKGVN